MGMPELLERSMSRPRNFAVTALVAVISFASNASYAYDLFDRPYQGLWLCPDGNKRVNTQCAPPEIFFADGGWWNACVPGRDDCAYSDTAFIGWNEMNRTKRGPGYCYTEQPYTCAPDGKWPR
jgi:hypothetical protein